jgi:hypothetical protein
MRYLMLLHGVPTDTPPPDGLMEAIMALGEEATRAGVLLDTAGLAPSAAGARVDLAAGKLSVTDGPFTEAKELVGGWGLIEARDRDEAIEWAKRFQGAAGDGEMRVRQVY